MKTEYKYTLTAEEMGRALGEWCNKRNNMPDGEYQVRTFCTYADGVLDGAEVTFTLIEDVEIKE